MGRVRNGKKSIAEKLTNKETVKGGFAASRLDVDVDLFLACNAAKVVSRGLPSARVKVD
jgi:hypothetical protein